MIYRSSRLEVEAAAVELAGLSLMVVMVGNQTTILGRHAFELLFEEADLSGEREAMQRKQAEAREAIREISAEVDALQKGVGPAESRGTLDLTGYPDALRDPARDLARDVYDLLRNGPCSPLQASVRLK